MKWAYPFTIKSYITTKTPRCKKQRGFCYSIEKDNRLETSRLQGGYLYDKGENDELCYVVGCPQPIYKYILSRQNKKVKEKIKILKTISKLYCLRKKC